MQQQERNLNKNQKKLAPAATHVIEGACWAVVLK